MKSPFTGKEMKPRYEKRSWKFRGDEYEYIHTSWICEDSGESFTTDESDMVSFLQVTNQYRDRYGIPYQDEIVAIREYYNVSASKMSLILGFGANQWRYYEDGEVPSVSNGRMIRSIMTPSVFLEMLNSSKHLLTAKEYEKISKNIVGKSRVDVGSRLYMCERSKENGFGQMDLNRLKNTLLYFIERIDKVFCTKMNKLLFYSDFLSYRLNGMSITGLTYKAIDYGPVPERWDRVYSYFDEIIQEPIVIGEKEGTILTSSEKADMSLFTDKEIYVLDTICSQFANCSSTELSRISHNEPAWLDCHESHARISYDYAFKLRGV